MRPQKPIFVGTRKGQRERAGEDEIGLHLNRKGKEITARADEQEPTKMEYARTSSPKWVKSDDANQEIDYGIS